jgi:hypothetical protein
VQNVIYKTQLTFNSVKSFTDNREYGLAKAATITLLFLARKSIFAISLLKL